MASAFYAVFLVLQYFDTIDKHIFDDRHLVFLNFKSIFGQKYVYSYIINISAQINKKIHMMGLIFPNS